MEAKEPKKNKIDELIEHGKAKGVLTYKEVMDALNETDMDSDQIEKLYDKFESMNIDVVDEELEVPENINEEIAEIENDASLGEGISIDDPVRMYLKEIGKGKNAVFCAKEISHLSYLWLKHNRPSQM